MDILFARTLVRDFWNSDRTRPKRQGYAVVMEPRGSGKVPGPKLCFVGLGAIEENNMKRWILARLRVLARGLRGNDRWREAHHGRGWHGWGERDGR
jgi:hypothetical protein